MSHEIGTARARALAVTLASLAGIAVIAWIYFPAFMSPDSLGMYREAMAGVIHGDRKMPLTAFLWSGIVRIDPSPVLLLVFQNAIFWSGLALVVYHAAMPPVR